MYKSRMEFRKLGLLPDCVTQAGKPIRELKMSIYSSPIRLLAVGFISRQNSNAISELLSMGEVFRLSLRLNFEN